MATISIDKSEFPNLADCAVGEPLELMGNVTKIKGDILTIDVSDVEYGETEEDAEEPAPKANPVTKIKAPRGRASY